MKILLIIFSLFCYSFSNAQTLEETKSDSIILNAEWQKKIDGKLDLIIENLTNKKINNPFAKSSDQQKTKQVDSLKNVIDTLLSKIADLENKVKSSTDTISKKENAIKSLNNEKIQNAKNCKIDSETREEKIKTLTNQITSLEQNEIASLIKEIDALKDQPYSFSSDILNSMKSRFYTLKDDEQKKITNSAILFNFIAAVEILKEANLSLEVIYSPSVEKLLTKLDDPAILPEFKELNNKKDELKKNLGKYCSTTTAVKNYLNGSEQIPDEDTRKIYIKDNAVPEAEGNKFLEDLCKKVIKDKNQNILREFSCQ